jgi:hypothetical protein
MSRTGHRNRDRETVTKQLVSFFRSLADKIESGALTPEQLQYVGEFYMGFLFREQVIEDNKRQESDEIDDDDMKKFYTLGWYVYTQILRGQPID